MSKRLVELILLGGFLLLAVLLYRSTAAYPVSVQGSTANYVRFLALSLGLLCAVEFFLCFINNNTKTKEKMILTTAPFKFWGLLILLFVYSLLLEPLGFYMASIIFLPVGMVVLGARKKRQMMLTTAGVMLFIFLVFEKLLSVPLPERIWFM